jgi:hypothetical protein
LDLKIMTDAREALLFKKVPDGYVFHAPNPWVFGRARYFLVDEPQKAQLLAAMTARSQLMTVVVLGIAFAVTYGASVTAIMFVFGPAEPGIGSFIMMVVMAVLSLFAAIVIAARPAARRVQPLLTDLTPTDQRITVADRRLATRNRMSAPAQLVVAASQGILSAVLFMQATQKSGGNLASVFANPSAWPSAFAGCCFAFASISLLFAAVKKFGNKQEATVAADRSLRKFLTPAISLAITFVALGITIYGGHIETKAVERRQKSVEISHRQSALTEHIQNLSKRQASVKTRSAANSARMNVLVNKFNHPTVKCESGASTNCAERARQERQAVEAEIETTRKESDALRQEAAAQPQEIAAIRAELAAIQAAMDANR